METQPRMLVLAVSHPTRMAILDALSSGVKVSPEAFAERRKLAPSALSYHFKVLEGVGAIEAIGDEFKITERGLMLRNLAHSPDHG